LLITPQYRTYEPSAFAQDDWKITKTLILNLGVRWEYFSPLTEKRGRIANFDNATARLSNLESTVSLIVQE
jgi:hypothetical protein